MKYLQVILTAVISIVVLFIITRILGYRQLSEMSMFDYVNGITIGSIAAELATCEKGETVQILLAMIIYGVFALFVSIITDKSLIARRIITGKPIVLVEKGKLIYKSFKRARLDINEFLMKCRNSGYFDLSQIYTAVLEPNGKISFIPTSLNKPVTAQDMKILPQQDMPLAEVIIDGKIVDGTLETIGKDKKWLLTALKRQGIDDIGKVFLATCDNTGNIVSYSKSKNKPGSILE